MYYGIIAVFCVIAIGIGMANAMDLTQSPGHIPHGKGQVHPGFDLTNVTQQQEMISRFEQQGTDVSGLKAAFESGDMTAVKTWLDANRPARSDMPERSARPGFDLTNTTLQQEMISRFEQKGTDVTGLKAAFASGNMTDVKTWLDANRPAHYGKPEQPAHPKFDITNVTQQQEMISRFEQQGTDVTGLKAAFASGNMTDVKTWLDANRPTHPGWQHNHVQEKKTAAS